MRIGGWRWIRTTTGTRPYASGRSSASAASSGVAFTSTIWTYGLARTWPSASTGCVAGGGTASAGGGGACCSVTGRVSRSYR